MQESRLNTFLCRRAYIAVLHGAVRLASFVIVWAAFILACPGSAYSASPGTDACANAIHSRSEVALAFVSAECAAAHEVVVLSEEGTRDIRLVYDASLVDAAAPMLLREFERALHAIPSALQQLGSFRLDPVRVQVTAGSPGESSIRETALLDAIPPPQPLASTFHGHAHDMFTDIVGTTSLVEGECRIHLHVLSPDARVESAAPVLLHEFFHCVQLATLDAELTQSGAHGMGSGGDWWIEGSAEWFAALALPEVDLLQQRLTRFDRVSADTPLHQMSYEAVVFFLWLGSARHPWAVIPFLKRMALEPDPAAQAQAMMKALPLEGWMEFARHYMEGRIPHPHDTPLTCRPTLGEDSLAVAKEADIELEPFVLYRGWYEAACAAAPEKTSALTNEAAIREQFPFMSLAAAAEPVFLQLESALKNGCRPCEGAAAIDACLVGVSF